MAGPGVQKPACIFRVDSPSGLQTLRPGRQRFFGLAAGGFIVFGRRRIQKDDVAPVRPSFR